MGTECSRWPGVPLPTDGDNSQRLSTATTAKGAIPTAPQFSAVDNPNRPQMWTAELFVAVCDDLVSSCGQQGKLEGGFEGQFQGGLHLPQWHNAKAPAVSRAACAQVA